ncbi:MAG: DUF2244 domain-containing protein [Pseudorhodoplanes sp.]|nr:DUF2244 domain-containing protein [Pseudorhodoplanes sp.]
MTPHNDPISEPALFSATITPNRSLPRSGFLAVMIAIGGISFVTGLVFALMGAWPVLGFLGLDVLLIYWAFRANYRAGTACETVTVTPSEIAVRNVGHRGHVTEWTANPLWARLERETSPDFGLTRLFVVSRSQKRPVADFLSPHEREDFATALSAALVEARRGPTRTVFS